MRKLIKGCLIPRQDEEDGRDKVMFLTIICILFLISGCSHYQLSKWSGKDTAYQAAFTTVAVMDWAQTRYIANHPYERSESNRVLGEHPSLNDVDTYFSACIIGHTIVSYLLPSEVEIMNHKFNLRRIWQSCWIVIETGCVGHNMSVGVGMAF